MTKIKTCGLFRDIDIDFANEAKPDYIGFIIGVPKSHRNITEETARRLKSRLTSEISAVGVFINYPAESAAKLYSDGIIDVIQLHGSEDEGYISKLRELAPDCEIWKAFAVRSEDDVKAAKICTADRILLDSGTGCGKMFDWSVLSNVGREFILAGGLTPENIPLAIKQIKPYAVDLSSGIETHGVKDREKIEAAVKAARGAI